MRSPTPRPLLNVHAVQPLSYANGPGARAVVWVQGCRLHCFGCCNPGTHAHGPRFLVDPDRLASAVLAWPRIEGLTISGGEPFEQAAAVAQLCRCARASRLTIMVFTGWTLERIRRSRRRAVRDLLDQIDLLVDGPYVRELADARLLWRGSQNQRLHFLTDRCQRQAPRSGAAAAPQVEFRVAQGTSLGLTGFPERSDLEVLTSRLRQEAGILLEPAGQPQPRGAQPAPPLGPWITAAPAPAR